MDLWIFNIGRGLCVSVRTPNNYLILLDCGHSQEFSPIQWLGKQQWTPYEGHQLTKLIVSHPHLDHISDIERVSETLPPGIIKRRKDLNWDRVTSGGSGDTSPVKHFRETYLPPRTTYTETASDPDWGQGFQFKYYQLGIDKVAEVSSTDSSYVNNSSCVITIKYNGYCFVLNGDIESEGMVALLNESQNLRNDISSGVHFYLTPHHGHTSSFSSEWFNIAGPTKILNIASERRKRPGESDSMTNVDSRYSQENYCLGQNNERRRMISTKSDGHLRIWVNSEGKWNWEGSQ